MANLKKKVEIVIDGKDRSGKAAGKATMAMKRLGAAAKAAGIAVAAASAASAVVIGRQVKATIDLADATAKVSTKIGVAVEDLTALGYAAQLSGVEQNTLNMALQRFSRRVAEAAKGEGVLKDVMADLGIELRDANGQMRDNVDILDDFADAIKNAESDQERLRLAFKAFDSEGAALVNLLRHGSAGMREMTNEAAKLGIVIDTHTAKRAEQFNDQMTRIKAAGKGFSVMLTAELLPSLIRMADSMVLQVQRFNEWRDSANGLQKTMQNLFIDLETGFLTVTSTMRQFWDGLRLVWEILKSVGIIIGHTAAIINDVLVRRIESAVDIFKIWRDYMSDVIKTAKMLAWSVVNVAEAMTDLATGNMDGIRQMRKTLVSMGKQFDNLAKNFKDSFTKTSDILAKTFKQDMENAIAGVEGMFNDLGQNWKVLRGQIGMPFYMPGTTDQGGGGGLFQGKGPLIDPEIDREEDALGLNGMNEELAKFNGNLTNTQTSVENFGQTVGQSFGNAASSISNAALMAQDMGNAAKQAGTQIVQTFIDLAIRRVIDGAIMKGQAAAGIAAMGGITAANVTSAGATAAAWAPAAAAVSLATFGANSVPANAGLISTFALSQSLSALGKLSSVVLGQAHDGVVFPRSGSYLMNVQKGEQIIPRTPGPTSGAQSSGPMEINIQLGTKTLARGVVDAVRGGLLNLKISNNQRVVAA